MNKNAMINTYRYFSIIMFIVSIPLFTKMMYRYLINGNPWYLIYASSMGIALLSFAVLCIITYSKVKISSEKIANIGDGIIIISIIGIFIHITLLYYNIMGYLAMSILNYIAIMFIGIAVKHISKI